MNNSTKFTLHKSESGDLMTIIITNDNPMTNGQLTHLLRLIADGLDSEGAPKLEDSQPVTTTEG